MDSSIWKITFQSLYRSKLLTKYVLYTFLAALTYYSYNEAAFLCLDKVSTVSHTIANTLKRVFIILASVVVFGNRITPQGILGSALAIGGVFLYSLAKDRAKKNDLWGKDSGSASTT
jgi:solute carrier family 35 protein E1